MALSTVTLNLIGRIGLSISRKYSKPYLRILLSEPRDSQL